jgi:cystathionine beta-lyase/cystathionine gamma-synthase
VVTPIVRSSTFVLDDEAYALRAAGQGDRARIYSRETNPTIEAVEALLASLEGAESALLFASGMAAEQAALLSLLERGDRVVVAKQLFGGSRALLDMLLPALGVELVLVDVADHDAVAEALDERTRLLFVESISNPTAVVADVPVLAALVRANRMAEVDGVRRSTLLMVDATLASPAVQRPLALGADLVLHSATKFLGGHSDLIAGVLAGPAELVRPTWDWRTRGGACADPTAAWLLERGIKTLHLRLRASCDGASGIAGHLARHPRVAGVDHPSLESHPTADVARRVLDLPGGLLGFVVESGDDAALAAVRRLRLILEATSLGGTETLVSLPFNMSHSAFTAAERADFGIPPGHVRLSVGVEDPADLIADLDRALADD